MFLTERLATELSPEQFAAVACHEYGHLVRCHVPIRLAIPAGFAVCWVTASSLLAASPFLLGVGLLCPTVVGSALVGRWSEFDADGRTRGDRLATALVQLARENHLGGRSAFHPRLSRLADTPLTTARRRR